jgi:cytochrome c biogenesis protein CcmG/thiol:disulfide interchange protein DsbE
VFAVTAGDEEPNASDRCPVAVAEASSPHIGDPAPTFTLPTLAGGCFRLAAAPGEPVIVNFWASWCNPCRREFPLLADAAERGRAEVVGVTYRDIESDSRRFADEQDAGWSLVFDGDGEVARAYGVTAIPQTIFVRADGMISGRLFGELTRSELDRALRKAQR